MQSKTLFHSGLSHGEKSNEILETALNITYRTQVVCTPPLYIPTPTTLSTLQIHRHPPCTTPYTSIHTTLSYYSYLFVCFLHRLNYDLLGEPSAVDPTVLHPAEQLQWSISSESARDIDIAKKNLDKYVHVLCSF